MKGTYLIVNPEEKVMIPGGSPAGGPPAGEPPMGPPPGNPPAGDPPMGPPPAGAPMGGGMPSGPLSKELKLVWDGKKALWTNERGEEVLLEQVTETENALQFVAMAGPAPIEWTLTRTQNGYSATSHRGADIHGNPPVDTICKVTKIF